MMHTSAAMRTQIEKWEGCRLQAYQDMVGVWTIGYGHTGPDVVPGLVITKDQADALMRSDLEKFERGVDRLCGLAPTRQGQFDALVSFAYNVGLGKPGGNEGLTNSAVLRHHLAGEYDDAADAFLLYDHAGGREVEVLAERRRYEGQLYMDASP